MFLLDYAAAEQVFVLLGYNNDENVEYRKSFLKDIRKIKDRNIRKRLEVVLLELFRLLLQFLLFLQVLQPFLVLLQFLLVLLIIKYPRFVKTTVMANITTKVGIIILGLPSIPN